MVSEIIAKKIKVVDFFELEGQIVTCYCYAPADETEENYTPVEVKLDEFEEWLSGEGYLKGDYESVGCPHRGLAKVSIWSYTIHEFMAKENHNWNIEELLTTFLNTKTK